MRYLERKEDNFDNQNKMEKRIEVNVGDRVVTEFGIGDVMAIGKSRKGYMVKMIDNREVYVTMEYIKEIFSKYDLP